MSNPLILAALMMGSPAAGDYLPCRLNMTIEYRWFGADGRPTASTRTDRVQKQQGTLCFIRRTLEDPKGRHEAVYVLEILPDRVLEAGWAGELTAFRAPLIRSPIEDQKRWRFNRVDYALSPLKAGHATEAGRFDSVIRVVAESVPRGAFRATRFYARGVGLIEDRRAEGRWVATRIHEPGDGRR